MPPTSTPLNGKTVVVCVSGGIAAYKAAYLVRLLDRAGARVRVAMTDSAQRFVAPLTFQALTGEAVATDLLDLQQDSQIGHIRLADQADLVIVAPATANTLARLAMGMAGDTVTAVCLATRAPILLAPSMNVNMWNNAATQENLRRLVERGLHVLEPGEGFLACRWVGTGRLPEPEEIVEAAATLLTPQDLAGRKVVVTAGPTREPVDPVRFLTNRSSGRMGYAIARMARRRGAEVELITGPVAMAPLPGVTVSVVESAVSMEKEVTAAAEDADVVVMAAAVADYRIASPSGAKLKKSELGETTSLPLAANPDILANLGEERGSRDARRPILVGFAAETDNLIANAQAKLAAKGCDLIVANDVSQPDAGFDVETNRVVFVGPGEVEPMELAGKGEVAHRILDRVGELLEASE